KQVNGQNSLQVEAKRIDPSYIRDAKDIVQRKGNRKHLTILGKLHACLYVIKFYGVSELPDKNYVMVFEWVERGTLKEVYQNFSLRWKEKITIVRDICRELAFLQAVEILHHDIRCENVLITEKMQPKLCNFKFAHKINAIASQIDDMNAIIYWLAPEILNSYD
ncbi:2688_t:CDS:2, partial [Funneliformis caledonium]